MNNIKIELPTMLSIQETVELTGFSDYAVRLLIKSNKVVYIKNGNKYLINYDSLVSYLNTGETN